MRYLLIFSMFFATAFYGQEDIFQELRQPENGGTLSIIQEPNIELSLKDYIKKKSSEKGMNGYRVQIFFGTGHNSRNNAYQVRNNFASKYQDIQAHVIFQEPYFKVRVGDFRNKSEALKVLKSIEKDFEGAFIVKDYIQFPPLYKEEESMLND